MTSGPTPSSARAARVCRACSAVIFPARHMRGLEENIWSVFAPISGARRTALATPPVVERWTPINRSAICEVGLGAKRAFTLRRLFADRAFFHRGGRVAQHQRSFDGIGPPGLAILA